MKVYLKEKNRLNCLKLILNIYRNVSIFTNKDKRYNYAS